MLLKKSSFLVTILFVSLLFFKIDSVNAASHTVKTGETLYSIAKTYNITVADIKKENDLSSSVIPVGKTIQLPAHADVVKAKKSSAKTASATILKTLRVSSTAYTANCSGCSGRTKTGFNLRANPHAKIIAVDPKIIPLGTKVWVEGYGTAVAADTGGSIKGHKIDVFMSSKKKAYAWGRKKVTIKVYKS